MTCLSSGERTDFDEERRLPIDREDRTLLLLFFSIVLMDLVLLVLFFSIVLTHCVPYYLFQSDYCMFVESKSYRIVSNRTVLLL
mmetsp:Transcript_48063/g.54462  ORF Transcript_48063/g.54462 Transcript_48063/m.54462 type:complete len:84 (-) Transcript_48063:114-365(-)